MKRNIAAIIVGLIAWLFVVSIFDRLLRLGISGYAAAEVPMTFTLPMMAARLAMSAATSLIAGAIVGLIAVERKITPWIVGAILLGMFIPTHVHFWQSFPLWYHLSFLVPLAPLVVLGAALSSREPRITRQPSATVASSKIN